MTVLHKWGHANSTPGIENPDQIGLQKRELCVSVWCREQCFMMELEAYSLRLFRVPVTCLRKIIPFATCMTQKKQLFSVEPKYIYHCSMVSCMKNLIKTLVFENINHLKYFNHNGVVTILKSHLKYVQSLSRDTVSW